ncbi:hypothetical protein [Neobacillus massiliamazoniensis]|uniref:Uncharacterized protein n=1 Tax=Neobacillus massiliamazoniensis TaxID=1499688 RepID=A0A0U1NRL0_9BACI|nr:hypothetical protein [Neobacillus massiliamazoniensis]CRK80388.1 hypothetical protein BN000_00271 [Neobacillus massiliamazoniensis]
MSEEITFNQEYISYKPKKQKVFPVQEQDWKKIKDMISRCEKSERRSYKDISLVLLGGSISAILSLVALYNITNVASWIMNSNWIILICSLLIGIGFFYLDKQQNELQTLDIKQITEEMNYIEQKYDLTDKDQDAS